MGRNKGIARDCVKLSTINNSTPNSLALLIRAEVFKVGQDFGAALRYQPHVEVDPITSAIAATAMDETQPANSQAANCADLLYCRGRAIYAQSNPFVTMHLLEAMDDFTTALNFVDNHLGARVFRACAALQLDKWEQACIDLMVVNKRCFQVDKTNYYLGLAHIMQGNLTAAATAFTNAIYVNPTHAKAWLFLGYVQLFKHQFAEAGKSFYRAACLDSAWTMEVCAAQIKARTVFRAFMHHYLGCAAAQAKQLDIAMLNFMKVLELHRTHTDGYEWLVDEADSRSKVCCTMLKHEHLISDTAYYSYRGHAALDQGLLEDANADFVKALEQQPKNINAILGKAMLDVMGGRFNLALTGANLALSIDTQHVAAAILLGNILKAQGNVTAALDVYKRVITLPGVTRKEQLYCHVRRIELHDQCNDGHITWDEMTRETKLLSQCLHFIPAPMTADEKCLFAMAYAALGNDVQTREHMYSMLAFYPLSEISSTLRDDVLKLLSQQICWPASSEEQVYHSDPEQLYRELLRWLKINKNDSEYHIALIANACLQLLCAETGWGVAARVPKRSLPSRVVISAVEECAAYLNQMIGNVPLRNITSATRSALRSEMNAKPEFLEKCKLTYPRLYNALLLLTNKQTLAITPPLVLSLRVPAATLFSFVATHAVHHIQKTVRNAVFSV